MFRKKKAWKQFQEPAAIPTTPEPIGTPESCGMTIEEHLMHTGLVLGANGIGFGCEESWNALRVIVEAAREVFGHQDVDISEPVADLVRKTREAAAILRAEDEGRMAPSSDLVH